jgi:hypothetical protein
MENGHEVRIPVKGGADSEDKKDVKEDLNDLQMQRLVLIILAYPILKSSILSRDRVFERFLLPIVIYTLIIEG